MCLCVLSRLFSWQIKSLNVTPTCSWEWREHNYQGSSYPVSLGDTSVSSCMQRRVENTLRCVCCTAWAAVQNAQLNREKKHVFLHTLSLAAIVWWALWPESTVQHGQTGHQAYREFSQWADVPTVLTPFLFIYWADCPIKPVDQWPDWHWAFGYFLHRHGAGLVCSAM